MVLLYDVGVSGSMWHFPANILCGILSQVRTGDSSSQPWVESGIAQGRVLFLSLFNVLVDTSAASVRSVAPVVQLVISDAFRNTCHRHGDEVVLVSESQVDLHAGLNACHAWSIRSRFTFGIGPTKSAVMIFGPAQSRPDCHVHLGGYPLLGVLTPDLSWRAHVAHVSSCIDRLFHQSSARCHGEGLPVSIAVSVFDACVLSST